jgi:NAD+ kinase
MKHVDRTKRPRRLAFSLVKLMNIISVTLLVCFISQSPCRADAFTFLRSSFSKPSRVVNRARNSRLQDSFSRSNNVSNVTSSSESETETEKVVQSPVEGISSANNNAVPPHLQSKKQLDLMWCSKEYCKDAVRERVVGRNNQIYLNGPATGQVAYHWSNFESSEARASSSTTNVALKQLEAPPTVLLLIRPGDDDLLQKAADAVKKLTADGSNVRVLLDPSTAARLKYYHGVGDDHICLFEVKPTPGYGSELSSSAANSESRRKLTFGQNEIGRLVPNTEYMPDLICTLGGDGLLMHASMIFQGPVPPILCVSGGSLGFLTPFRTEEMVDAIKVALGLVTQDDDCNVVDGDATLKSYRDMGDNVYPPNMPSYPYEPLLKTPVAPDADFKDNDGASLPRFSFGRGSRICLSIRMRLECTVISREGSVRARYNVLNEVVIDRGSSPYLAALECFCDDVHLTTVQADGVIFATPTGSTAYSLAAGSSVVHPAVPCILVTPICPHVLSFRSMVFPDHVVLRCYVPDDARAVASVAFDGKHRQELARGDSVQIRMSSYPVPTINRDDHSSDWLGSLKRNFNFNSRARQQPL